MNKKHSAGCQHHHHHHHPVSENIKIAFWLNFSFTIIEIVGGLYTNSLAILSDAVHDLGDTITIGLAWLLEKKSKNPSSLDYTYGHRRLSTLSALITGTVLIVGSAIILYNAIPRLFNPEQPNAEGMLALSLLGIFVNGIAAYRLSKSDSLNERMILLHMMEDVLGWVFVLIGSVVMMFYTIPILDAIMACGLAIWVLFNAIKNLSSVLRVFLQGVPKHVNQFSVIDEIKSDQSVQDVHHLHIWSIDGEHHYLTAHVMVKDSINLQQSHQMKLQIKKSLKDKFHIVESSIEIEWPEQKCLDPNH